jgi:hypothetical protein
MGKRVLKDGVDVVEDVLGQVARVCSRIGDELVMFVQSLERAQCPLGRIAVSSIGLSVRAVTSGPELEHENKGTGWKTYL